MISDIASGIIIDKITNDNLDITLGEEKLDFGYYPTVEGNVYAIGDIHGDSGALFDILMFLAQVVTSTNDVRDLNNLHWKPGNNSKLVFCGDLIDRLRFKTRGNNVGNVVDVVDDENSDLKIIRTLDRLDVEAREHGGRIFILLGNHELAFNFEGNFSYVSDKGNYNRRNIDFNKGSAWAKYIADNTYTCLKLGNIVFSHAGFCEISDFLKKSKHDPVTYINAIVRYFLYGNEHKLSQEEKNEYYNIINSDKSLINCRLFGRKDDKCDLTNEIFTDLRMDPNNSYMLVAHTPQMSYTYGTGINSICDDKIWRIDCAMSKAFDISIDYLLSNFDFNQTVDFIKKEGVDKLEYILNLHANKFRKLSILKFESNDNENFTTNRNNIITSSEMSNRHLNDNNLAINNLNLLFQNQKLLSLSQDVINEWREVAKIITERYYSNYYKTKADNPNPLKRQREPGNRKYKIIY